MCSSTPEAKGLGMTLVLASATAYGAMPVLGKLAYGAGVPVAGLLAYRFVIAAALFALMSRRRAPPPLRTRLVLWGLGAVFVVNCLAYFASLRTLPASVVALVLYTYPVLVTLLSAVAGLEPLTARSLVAAALAFGGTALTVGTLPSGTPATGLVLALVAAFGYSSYIVLGSRFAAGVPSDESARHVSETCVAFFVPWAALKGELDVPPTFVAWGSIVGIAVVCTVFALRTFLAGLARVGPSRAAVASAFEILVAVALAVAFLGESVGPRQLAGGALILGGVALQALGRQRRGTVQKNGRQRARQGL
jgi:drug/metabolite transporter (DMT)-like permease